MGGHVGSKVALAIACAAVSATTCRAAAQSLVPSGVDSLDPIVSMGQPSPFYPYAGAVGGWGWRDDDRQGAARVMLGLERDLIQPVVGILGVAAEGYAGTLGGRADAGARLLGTMRILRVGVGADVSFVGRGTSFVLTITEPLRRGGVFGGGSELRVDWLRNAGRSSWAFGVTVPVARPWVGRTRPHETDVRLPKELAHRLPASPVEENVQVEAALRRARRAALAIDALTTPAFRPNDGDWLRDMRRAAARMKEHDADYPHGHTFPIEIDAYHRALTDVFIAAGGGDTARGDAAAGLARRVILDELLIPYDAYYGRFRPRPVLDALTARARDAFARSLDGEGSVATGHRDELETAFARVLQIVREDAAAAEDRWGDSRDVWLPLQLALRQEDYDTQGEVDHVVQRIVGRELEPGNDLSFLPVEAFSRALRRSIRDTRSYHVLWIHDFAGVTPSGETDSVAYRTVLAYIRALTRAAHAFDSRHTLPRFMIFLDQWFYTAKGSRRWISLLERPLNRDVKLPPEFQGRMMLRSALDSLRAAVAESPALQAEARRRGARWLDNVMSVRVSVTNPADPSYSGPRIVPNDLRESLSDNWMRDHRKIVFYDLDEHEPWKGGALFTGEGVGQEYENAGWEDRTVAVRGPGVLTLKRDAVELLRSQGFRDEQIPWVLRPHLPAPNHAAQVDSLVRAGWTARVLVAQNGTGYLDKHASVLKATLYTLMPAGSRIVAPSPFWGSHAWAAILLGSALRGTHVMVLAPGRENFPGPPYIQLATTRTVFEGLLQMRTVWADQLDSVDGRLRVGLFHNTVPTRDVIGRLRELALHLRQNQFVRDEFPFPPRIYDLLEQPDSVFQHLGLAPLPDGAQGDSTSPKLHLKTQFFASASALRTMLALPQWDTLLTAYAIERIASSRAASDSVPPALSVEMLRRLGPTFTGRAPPERNADMLYLTVGSHNEDDLSRTHNGEVLCLVAGRASLTAVFDFVYLVASATWVDSGDDMDGLIPRSDWFHRLLARWEAQVL